MKIVTSILKVANLPAWANVTNFMGTLGYWVDTNFGQPCFLRKDDNVIWLPKTLRGKKIEDLSPEELKNVPKEDSGKVLYKQWRLQNDIDQSVKKLHNGYAFSEVGKALIDKLHKLVDKYELDDVTNIGLDKRFSVNPVLFEKMLQTNNQDDVKRLGRIITKKVATIIHLLSQVNPKIAKRLDADFMYQYKKLQALFDFDVTKFEPNIPEPTEPEVNYAELVGHIINIIKKNTNSSMEFYPALQSFSNLQNALNNPKPDINAAQGLYSLAMAELIKLGQTNEQFAQLVPSLIVLPDFEELYNYLFFLDKTP